jgi:hypothetical protein
VVLPVCYNEIVQLGDTGTNYQIAAGDRIYVASKTFWEDITHDKKQCPPCGLPQTPNVLPPEPHCLGNCTGRPVPIAPADPPAEGAAH